MIENFGQAGGQRAKKTSTPRGWSYAGTAGGGAEQYSPPAIAGAGGGSSLDKPGTFDINLLDPVGSAQAVPDEIGTALKGFKAALFGTDQPDVAGQHGGIIDVPVLSDALRFGTEVVGNVASTAGGIGKGALDIAGGAMEHVDFLFSNPAEVKRQFDAMPESTIKAEAREAMRGTPGSLIGPANSHIMSAAIRAYAEEKAPTNPELFTGMFSAPGSLADAVTSIFDALGAPQRVAERLIAGAGRPGSEGMNQLQMIMAVGDGKMAWTADDPGLTDSEQIVYDKIKNREWTETQALDFMASHGLGLAHSKALEIAGSVATDPLNLAAGAAGIIARGGKLGVKLAQAGDEIKTIKAVGSSARKDVLGRIAEKEATADLVRIITKPYVGMQGTSVGKTAKIARTIIDPFHAMGNPRTPAAKQMVEMTGELVTKAGIEAMGDIGHERLIGKLHGISPELERQFSADLGVHYGNRARSIVMNRYLASVMTQGEEAVAALRSQNPSDLVDEVLKAQKGDVLLEIKRDANKFRIQTWDEDALDNLAGRMESQYKLKTKDEWREFVDDLSSDQRSLLHQATYGQVNRRLLDAVSEASDGAHGIEAPLAQRVIILSKTTLTRLGAQGIVDRMTAAAGDTDTLLAEMREAQRLYPTLRYIPIDPNDVIGSANKLSKHLTKNLDAYPMQITNEEAAKFTGKLADLNASMRGEFTLGFRPEEQYLWGLDRLNINGGQLSASGNVWVDHVSDGDIVARSATGVEHNILGQAIRLVTRDARIVSRPLDYIEAAGRTLKAKVDGGIIVEAARGKFIGRTTTKWAQYGMTEDVAKEIWDNIQEATSATYSIVNPRGFNADQLWQAAGDVIPRRVAYNGFDKRELMSTILEAYNGDLRFIGVTQKFTARMKQALSFGGRVNWAGQIAENAWPTLKFRLNLVFQAQERIEALILNAQRGVTAAIGDNMNEADRSTEALLQTQIKHSIRRMGDADQGEFHAQMMAGTGLRKVANKRGGKLNAVISAGDALINTKGAKRVNMLRTFRSGLAKEMRPVYDEFMPGVWDDMLQEAQRKAGTLIPDDDFAIQMITENMLGNDIMMRRLAKAGGTKIDFGNAIRPGQWSQPQTLGQLERLDIDGAAAALGLGADRAGVGSEAGLRRGLANGDIHMDDVREALRLHGADPDYIRRFESALGFQWEGFLDEIAERFHIAKGDTVVRDLEEVIARTAAMRGMTPAEYMSQIFSPQIISGTDGTVGALGGLKDIITNNTTQKVKDLAHLAADDLADRNDLIRQMAVAFSYHLDPSAKVALMREFSPTLRQTIDKNPAAFEISNIADLFSKNPEVQEAFAKRIISYTNDVPFEETQWATDAASFEAKWASKAWPHGDYLGTLGAKNPAGGPDIEIDYTVSGLIGQELRNAPEAQQAIVYSTLDRLMTQFPDTDLHHVNIYNIEGDLGLGYKRVRGITSANADGTNSFIVLTDLGHGVDDPQYWADVAARNEMWRQVPKGQRESAPGRAMTVGATAQSDIIHEFGHAVENKLLEAYGEKARGDAAIRFTQYWDEFEESGDARFISEYALNRLDPDAPLEPGNYADAFPEVFAYAFDPAKADELAAAPQRVQKIVKRFRRELEDAGVLERIKYTDSNPDVIRVNQMFAKWSTQALGDALQGRGNATISGILEDLGGMAMGEAVPFNMTESLMVRAAHTAMEDKWRDAYRLQYFAQERSMIERSLNHPMFGLYPASYMWGKIAPEMIRFIAKEPFGNNTGAMAYTMMDVMRAVSIQREFDPEFDKKIEELGHSQALGFLGYLLPGVPWDLGASAPQWAKELSQQGLQNIKRTEEGDVVKGIDLSVPLLNTFKKLNPTEMQLPWAAKAIEEVKSFTPLRSKTEEELDAMIEQQKAQAPATPGAPEAPSTSEPIQATGLGPTLEEQMRLLTAVLGD